MKLIKRPIKHAALMKFAQLNTPPMAKQTCEILKVMKQCQDTMENYQRFIFKNFKDPNRVREGIKKLNISMHLDKYSQDGLNQFITNNACAKKIKQCLRQLDFIGTHESIRIKKLVRKVTRTKEKHKRVMLCKEIIILMNPEILTADPPQKNIFKETAQKLQIKPLTVYRVVERFEKKGWQILERKPRVRSKLTLTNNEIKKLMKKFEKNNPPEEPLKNIRWTGVKLQEVLAQNGIGISVVHARRALRKIKIESSAKTPRY